MSPEFQIIDEFVKKWNQNESLLSATNDDISNVENVLNIILPKSYKYLITTYGDIYTPDTLETIVDKEVDLNDIQNFELPNQAIEDTKSWQEAGLPSGYYAFASDSMGSMFCFKNSECQNKAQEPPVWFFDHDFVEIEKISENFLTWLGCYNEM